MPDPGRAVARPAAPSALDVAGGARAGPRLRLRAPSPGLLVLPWDRPLEQWAAPEAVLRELPVGMSRHLVRFVEVDGRLWAVKEMPRRVAEREYAVLRALEDRSLPAVRPAGLVLQPETDVALLVTRYLERSWQFRRLLMRLPPDRPRQRARLLDAMATLLVELHRNGVYWGDCSLANTLFSRDGQRLQAWLVDAETSEVHPALSPGQRRYDLDILVENVAGGLLDLAVMLDRPPEIYEQLIDEAASVATRYQELWDVLHDQPEFSYADRHQVTSRIRRLNELGFAVAEVSLEPVGQERLRLQVTVAERGYHSQQLLALSGLHAGEGQAQVLLGDLWSYEAALAERRRAQGLPPLTQPEVVRRWREDLFEPGTARAHEAVGRRGDPVQAYCDLLEVRWLLSEAAGHDVGDDAAAEALARRSVPPDSAAMAGVAEDDTAVLRLPRPAASPGGAGEADGDPAGQPG